MRDHLLYLEALKQKGIHLDLETITRLLGRLGNPQNDYKTILIGGTNGKGSTAAMISSIFVREGMTVGLYTSPHLRDFRERIRVNYNMIPGDMLCVLIEHVREEIREDVTYFEFATALGFLYFSRCRVDMAIIEVGMGGRLDATNLVSPMITVITNISMEHRKYLGNDLKSIAREKGGIIKEDGICMTAARGRKVIDTLEEICTQRKSVFYRTGRDIRIRRSGNGSFSYYGINKCYRDLRVSLAGRHQIENAVLALATVDVLSAKGMNIDDRSVVDGLRNTCWEGRLELVSDDPRIVLDGAHNPAGISSLCDALVTDYSYRRLIVVFGVLGDKEYSRMLKKLIPLSDKIVLTKPNEERAVRTADLLSVASPYPGQIEVADDPGEALVLARSFAGVDDLICVTGSLYLVGAIKGYL
ncbi:MAG: folylpolyglutamate synthase/dihydrofolate synthase family protein [Thermodesulfobacteriota bacterium]|nr:folylpolyglutamate synthase/dihydrofolate synthase family protein [Thermodesulfobacteriota bacterium]